uniref:DUF4371 domain-containing protein n=1 Tax=Kalanchoe fedtschenkoi TaxID=63787 RepID=A0A7N0U0M4_KALFE
MASDRFFKHFLDMSFGSCKNKAITSSFLNPNLNRWPIKTWMALPEFSNMRPGSFSKIIKIQPLPNPILSITSTVSDILAQSYEFSADKYPASQSFLSPSFFSFRKKSTNLVFTSPTKSLGSLQGALDKFVVKESQISLDNENIDVKLDENFDSVNNVVSNDDDHFIVDHSDTDDNDDIDSTHSLGGKECIKNLNDDRQNEEYSNSHVDIFDPRYWNALDSKMIDTLAVKSPKRDILFQKGPKNKLGRRFPQIYILEDWLVYSKELDRVFCFCCKIFKKGYVKGGLVNEGYEDWSHIGTRLQEHEVGMEHKKNWATWYELRCRLNASKTIDHVAQKQLKKERDHWKNVLVFHYLGHNIQNELISLIASSIKSEIMKKVRQAKYLSVILDCTPDISHQEQMSMILRYVDLFSSSIVIEESFLGFINVNDTTGQGLFDVLLQELKLLDLDVDNVRGQGYDNGSNMKGRHQEVQKKLLDINPRAFYTPCGSHSLNLMLCDMANTCSKARDFFGVIQRIYTIFANSTKKWQILKEFEEAKKIAIELDIDPVFPCRRQIRRKKVLDENFHAESSVASHTPEDAFRVNYFLYIVDQAIGSLHKRFEQYKAYENVFGFLFSSTKLNALTDMSLKSSCDSLAIALQNSDCNDIDTNELYLLKSYLRSSMSQERLNGLALIALENDQLEKVEYEDLI